MRGDTFLLVPLLPKPAGLGDSEWSAIQDAETRLLKAKASGDIALVVGCAKDMCEAVAKVVVAQRGTVLGSEDMPDLVNAAHKVLQFQPGDGLASDPETRQLAQGLKSIVLGVVGIRNRHGTGHGRAAPSEVTDDHAEMAFEATRLWCTWALRRLEPYIAGDVTALVRDLERGGFRRGDLTRRLMYCNVSRLSVEDQRRLGVAVARRGVDGGTFVVREDGIDDIDPANPEKWPTAYIEGVVAAMFFDGNGYLGLSENCVEESARLIAGLPDPLRVLTDLAERVQKARAAHRTVLDDEERSRLLSRFAETAGLMRDDRHRELWLAIRGQLERDPERDPNP